MSASMPEPAARIPVGALAPAEARRSRRGRRADAGRPPAPDCVFLADWLPPDFGAVGQYAHIFAAERAAAGRGVRLIGLATRGASDQTEAIAGGGWLRITRLRARPAADRGYPSRLAWALASNLRLAWCVLTSRHAPGAEVIFTGSPPFMLFFAVLLKAFRRVRLTYRITDFYPEVVIAALPRRSPALETVRRVTWAFRRCVDRFEVLGEDQRRVLEAGGVDPARITLARDRSPVSIAPDQAPAAAPVELAGRFVLLYSGNYGVAHETDAVLEGLKRHHLHGAGRFALWINGSGVNAKPVVEGLRAVGAPVCLTPPAPLGELASMLVAADAHLITLRDGFAGIVLPSKVYGCLESGKPILFVGPEASDVHLLCSQAAGRWYRRVDPGDAAGFCAALDDLAVALEAA